MNNAARTPHTGRRLRGADRRTGRRNGTNPTNAVDAIDSRLGLQWVLLALPQNNFRAV